jgi:hypothetical protein
MNPPHPAAARIAKKFWINRYRPSHAREIPNSSAIRSASIGRTIWHT